MRLFVAFKVPDEGLKGLRKNFGVDGLKWVNEFHCTLKFLGEVEEGKVVEVRERLRNVKFEAFEAEFGEMGAFFSVNQARVIWVGLEPEEKIGELQKMIERSLDGMFEKEDRFKAHVTIARVKFVKDKGDLGRLLRLKVGGGKFLVDKFLLMKSELRREGPVYGAVEEYKLS